MTSTDVANLIKAAIGMDPSSIGLPAIEQATRARQVACHLPDVDAYWKHAQASPEEFQALIEAVVVPETWFFRDRGAFVILARLCQEIWLRSPPDRVLRVLSLPCSTGEEPYSMAMALLDAGLPADRFQIDAVDISQRALASAQQAVYGKNSFRNADRAFCDRYLRPVGREYRPIDSVRACVRFRSGNLFDAGLFAGRERYDAVFCRNLLIYFDCETQDRAVRLLDGLLAPAGMLFVAPSETGLLFKHDFVPTRDSNAFGFRKPAPRTRTKEAPAPARVWKVAPTTARVEKARIALPSLNRSVPSLPSTTVSAEASNDAALAEAMRLADEGRFTEAAASCETYLRQHRASAQAFYLLGLVRDAIGQADEAEALYRKALYLDPNHYETLVHFALLIEQQGHIPRARVLRERARHLDEKGRSSHD